MPIQYQYQFQDEKPITISGEVLYKHYVKENTTLSNINADSNRMTLYFGSQVHHCLVIEPGLPVTITFREFVGRRR